MKFRSIPKMILVLSLCLYTAIVFAAENIDPDGDDSQYAYGENTGWFNAEPTGNGGPGVDVRSDGFTGYLWAENIGWVETTAEKYTKING